MKSQLKVVFIACLCFLSLSTSASQYQYYGYHSSAQFKVTITNITKGISFTPLLAATHNHRASFFTVGEAASEEVSRIAEGGDISGLKALLDGSSNVLATANSEGLLNPGDSVELVIDGNRRNRLVSIVAMLLPTNDAMVALLGGKLPSHGKVTYYLDAYDGGTETNDEYCANIPGPQCGGIPFSPEDSGEGYIYPSPGIHGEADLSEQAYEWKGAVAKVVIERVN